MHKVLILGDPAVGKSCILLRFCEQKFQASHIATVGIDFKMKVVQVNGMDVKMQIWDTAGQERFQTITSTLYKGVTGVIVTFALNSKRTYDNVTRWVQQVIEENTGKKVQVVIIGNKSDLPADSLQVTEEMEKKLASNTNIPYFRTSAMTGENIDVAFQELAKIMVENYPLTMPDEDKLTLGNLSEDKKRGCC